jgi:hypothetical protein
MIPRKPDIGRSSLLGPGAALIHEIKKKTKIAPIFKG